MYQATAVYRDEAARRGLDFEVDVSKCPVTVVGDAKKICAVVTNLTANARKPCTSFILRRPDTISIVQYTTSGKIVVLCQRFEEVATDDSEDAEVAVEIVVSDTGCGISEKKLKGIFRGFEEMNTPSPPGQTSGSQFQSPGEETRV